jgi:hypothetical protein
MRKSTRLSAILLCLLAGLAAIEHGIFEILQGSKQTPGLFIVSMGPPCDPDVVWNACEPAFTILPNFLLTGILAVLFGVLTLLWAAFLIEHKLSGYVLIGLSIGSLLFGGGLFPPLIGIIGGIMALSIKKKIRKKTSSLSTALSKLYPLPLTLFVTWVLGQWVIGYFFNAVLKAVMGTAALLILALLPLILITARARDQVLAESAP